MASTDKHKASDTSRVNIDLNAIRSNFNRINSECTDAECAPVLKANAYGLGANIIATELYLAGARTFFVAFLNEAIELRNTLPKSAAIKIYVLEGNLPLSEPIFTKFQVIPIINSFDQLHRWETYLQHSSTRQDCGLHIDTGMNRLGLTMTEATINLNKIIKLKPNLIISHLSCADDKEHPNNLLQIERVKKISQLYPEFKISIANSSAIFLNTKYHFNMVRPGIALFGGNPTSLQDNPMQTVVTLESRLIQIRKIHAGELIGYGATFTSDRPMTLGTLAIGYADGLPRSLSNSSFCACFEGLRAKLIGRMSMDSIIIDLSDFKKKMPKIGSYFQLISPEQTIDEIADYADTISNEILTSLGGRIQFNYLNQSPTKHCV